MDKGYIYILTNKNLTILYVGATKNLRHRIELHRAGKAAIFTRKYNAVILIYFEEFDNYRDAFKREKQLKNWHRDWKWNLVKIINPEFKDLYLNL